MKRLWDFWQIDFASVFSVAFEVFETRCFKKNFQTMMIIPIFLQQIELFQVQQKQKWTKRTGLCPPGAVFQLWEGGKQNMSGSLLCMKRQPRTWEKRTREWKTYWHIWEIGYNFK